MLVQFGNNWFKKIPLTAKLDSAWGLVQFWLFSEFFFIQLYQIGRVCSPSTHTHLKKKCCRGEWQVNCRTVGARLKRNVGIEYQQAIIFHDAGSIQWRPTMASHTFCPYSSAFSSKGFFFLGVCESTVEHYISKFLVNGDVKPERAGRSYGRISFAPREELMFLHAKYGNHGSFRSCILRSTTAIRLLSDNDFWN